MREAQKPKNGINMLALLWERIWVNYSPAGFKKCFLAISLRTNSLWFEY